MGGKTLAVEFYSKIVEDNPELTCICLQVQPSSHTNIFYTVL